MPALDRRIVIERKSGERNSFGEFVGTWSVLAEVWAQRTNVGAVDVEFVGGVQTVEARQYTVRWREDLYRETPARLRIRDGLDPDDLDDEDPQFGFRLRWNVQSISESDARRRALFIQCVRAD